MKKILSAILVLAMTLSLFATTAFALEEPADSVEIARSSAVIPDDVLYDALLEQVNRDLLWEDENATPKTILTYGDLRGMDYLYFYGYPDESMVITDFTGIELCTALNDLTLYDNPLTSLEPFADLENLGSLGVINCGLTTLTGFDTFQGELYSLNVSNNEISDISALSTAPFADTLESLYLSESKVTNLAQIKDLPALVSLDVSQNEISDWSVIDTFVNKNNLEDITAAAAKVTDLAVFKNLPALGSLNVSENNLSSIAALGSFASKDTIYSIDLSNNKITDLAPIKNLTTLEYLYINDNYISDLSPLTELDPLPYVDISNNLLDMNDEATKELIKELEESVDPESFSGVVNQSQLPKDGYTYTKPVHIYINFSTLGMEELFAELDMDLNKLFKVILNGKTIETKEMTVIDKSGEYDFKMELDIDALLDMVKDIVKEQIQQSENLGEDFPDLVFEGDVPTEEEIESYLEEGIGFIRSYLEEGMDAEMVSYEASFTVKLPKTEEPKEEPKEEIPDTGSTDILWFGGILSVSLVGALAMSKKRIRVR